MKLPRCIYISLRGARGPTELPSSKYYIIEIKYIYIYMQVRTRMVQGGPSELPSSKYYTT